ALIPRRLRSEPSPTTGRRGVSGQAGPGRSSPSPSVSGPGPAAAGGPTVRTERGLGGEGHLSPLPPLPRRAHGLRQRAALCRLLTRLSHHARRAGLHGRGGDGGGRRQPGVAAAGGGGGATDGV